MVLVDLRYIEFIRGLTRERQLLDSASDFLILSLNLAGAGVAGATTKTVLSSIAAGVGGTKVIVDRDFFYQKTVPALVAAMNAQRAEARVPPAQGVGSGDRRLSLSHGGGGRPELLRSGDLCRGAQFDSVRRG